MKLVFRSHHQKNDFLVAIANEKYKKNKILLNIYKIN